MRCRPPFRTPRRLPLALLSLILLPLAVGGLIPPRAAAATATSAPGVEAPLDAVRPAGQRSAGVTTVIVVRHAEKAAVPGSDPPLSAEGEARSLALLDALRDAGVQAVIVTQLQRTRQTAAPLARFLGIEPEVVRVAGDAAEHARQVAEQVLSRHEGRIVLVVGHSNTVPAIVEALGAGRAAEIPDDRYHDLYVVTRPPGGATRRLHLRYGS